MNTSTYDVVGMTCAHCEKAVTEELADLDGVTAVTVDLVPNGTSHVTVTSDQPLDRTAVVGAIGEAGYALAQPGSLPLV